MKRAMTMVLALALGAIALPSLAAQQAPATPVTSPAPASDTSARLPGPRLQPEWRRYEPRFADSSAALNKRDSVTITASTLALVLIIIIIVLLV
jgi:hypothetical protein